MGSNLSRQLSRDTQNDPILGQKWVLFKRQNPTKRGQKGGPKSGQNGVIPRIQFLAASDAFLEQNPFCLRARARARAREAVPGYLG